MLIPDFQGNWDALATVMDAGPDILNHNIETVPRLYSRVRPKAIYTQSLELLQRAKSSVAAHADQVRPDGRPRRDARRAAARSSTICARNDVDVLTVGQYLRPSLRHLPVERYVPPEEFEELKAHGSRAWASATSRAARWCAPATTRTPSYNSR